MTQTRDPGPAADKEVRLALGLMSGMSMDGLDLALVRLRGRGDRPTVELVACETRPYDEALRSRLQRARGPWRSNLEPLERDLTLRWGGWVRAFLASHDVQPEDVDVLGSHGQTIHHRPREGGRPAQSVQIGHGVDLQRQTGIPVVHDFRQADIQAGGEGAPLVPMADWILYAADGVSACHNLGSIANVTVITPSLDDVMAFDTGPANMLIDAFARRIAGDIDRDGALSAQGRVDDDVLLTLYVKRAAWLAQPPPKSAGYGTFGPELVEEVLAAHPHAAPHDLVRTAVAFTARTIGEAHDRFVKTRHPGMRLVRFSGGGTRNPTLMEAIRTQLGKSHLVAEVVADPLNDAKEAVAFALLADRTLRGLPGNVPSATGAGRSVVLGRLVPGTEAAR